MTSRASAQTVLIGKANVQLRNGRIQLVIIHPMILAASRKSNCRAQLCSAQQPNPALGTHLRKYLLSNAHDQVLQNLCMGVRWCAIHMQDTPCGMHVWQFANANLANGMLQAMAAGEPELTLACLPL